MRTLNLDTAMGFTAWITVAARPHTAELRHGQLFIDAEWVVTLRHHGALLAELWPRERLLWTRENVVAELIRLTKVPRWESVRSALTAWRVKHSVKGPTMPHDLQAALTDVLTDPSAARFALDTTRLESILAASTARGIHVDVESLEATQARMRRTHRQLQDLLGFDPLPEENKSLTLAWLARHGVHVDGVSSEDWAGRALDDNPLAPAAEEAYEQALWLRRRYPKVREIAKALRRGKVHSTWTPFAQVSGRISSTGPAINNIAKDQRHFIVARPGHVLVTADFDGVEPRVLAGLSGDGMLASDLAKGDPYADAAERAGLDRLLRRNAMKIAMLAAMYGSQPGRTARQLSCTLQRAELVRDAMWSPYPHARAWLDEQRGWAPARLDSGRPLGVVEHSHARPNLLVQSTAYDIFQAAVLRVYDALPKGAHILISQHDELIIETPERDVETVCALLTEQMRSDCRGVPITASPVVLGTHWGNA